MKTLSVKLPSSLANWLASEARERGRTQSDLVREAIEEKRKRNPKPNCDDLLKDIRGVLKGPADLSTNPKHFQGFGQ